MSGWWDQIEPEAKDLACRIAKKIGLRPEGMCLPYQPVAVYASSSLIYDIPEHDLIPVWAAYVGLARLALATRDEQAVDDVVAPVTPVSDDAPVTFRDDPDAAWRRERGLDGEDQE